MGRRKATVDKVAVRVYPDTTGFAAEMRRVTERRWSTDVTVFLDSAEAKAMMERIENTKRSTWIQAKADVHDADMALKKLSQSKTYVDLDVRTKDAQDKVLDFRRKILDLNKRIEPIEIELKHSRTALVELEEMRKEANRLGKEYREAFKNDHGEELEATRLRVKELGIELRKLNDEKYEVQVETGKAKEELHRLTEDQKIKAEVELEAAAARAHLMVLTRARIVNVIARLKTSEFMMEMRKITAGVTGLTMMENWARSMSTFFQNLPRNTLRIAGLATALGGVASVAGAMLGSIAPIGKAIGEIAPGALFAIPAVGGLTAAISVLVMAFKDLEGSDNIQGKAFFKQWEKFKEGMSDVRDSVRTALFSDEFTASFTRLSDRVVPQLKSLMTGLAGVMGDIGASSMDAWREAMDDGALERFFDNLSFGLVKAKPGITDLITGLTNIATKGSEVFPEVGEWLAKTGSKFKTWTESADIATMLKKASTQMGYLWTATKNFGGVITGVFKAMNTGKSTGLESFATTLGRIRTIVNSKDFQYAMYTVFSGAAVGAEALRAALGPVGRDLEKLSPLLSAVLATSGGTAASALKGIATALSTPTTQMGLVAALTGLSDLARNIPWTALGDGLGSAGALLGRMAPLVTTIVTQAAPLLPLVLDAMGELVPPMTKVVTTLLPPAVSLASDLLAMVRPLAPAIVAIGTAFLGWKVISTIIKPVAGAFELMTAFKAVSFGTEIGKAAGAMKDCMKIAETMGDRLYVAKAGFAGIGSAILSNIGPLAAIGALTAVLGLGLSAWEDHRKKVEANKQAIRDFKDTLDATTGAITENTTEMTLKSVKDKVAQADLDKLGLSYVDLTAAILGSADAHKKVQDAIDGANQKVDERYEKDARWSIGLQRTSIEMAMYGGAIQNVNGTYDEMSTNLETAQRETVELHDQMEKLRGRTKIATPPISEIAAAILGLSNGTDAAKNSLNGLGDALTHSEKTTNDYYIEVERLVEGLKESTNAGKGFEEVNGEMSVAARENKNTLLGLITESGNLYESWKAAGDGTQEMKDKLQEARTAFRKVAEAICGNNPDAVERAMALYEERVGAATEADIANTEAMHALEAKLTTTSGQQFRLAAETAAASGKLQEQRDDLVKAGEAAGISAGEVDNYINYLTTLPSEVVTTMQANTAQAVADIEYATRNRTLWVTLEERGWGANSRVGSAGARWATGGSIWGPGTGTSDSILARLSNGEFVVRAAVAAKYRGLLSYLNQMGSLPQMPGFASGGTVGFSSIMESERIAMRALVNSFAAPASMVIPAVPAPVVATCGPGDADARAVALLEELVAQGRSGAGLSQATVTRALVQMLAPGMDREFGARREDRERGI